MARTTLVLEDSLLRQLKKKAAEEGRSLQAVANELIRRGLAPRPAQNYRLKLQGWKADLQPGVDLLDRNSLFDAMDRK
jgi:plasmid stability protein